MNGQIKIDSKPGIPVDLATGHISGLDSKPSNPYINLWTMHYRHGNNPGLTRNFYLVGDQAAARNLANTYCQAFDYRLMYIVPFITDLENEMKKKHPQINEANS